MYNKIYQILDEKGRAKTEFSGWTIYGKEVHFETRNGY